MYHAILQRLPHVVELILQHEVIVNAQIGHFFNCRWHSQDKARYCSKYNTWLTLAVEYNAASCVEVFIQHGADICALDGAGRSAISSALLNAAGPHPRDFHIVCHSDRYMHESPITAEQDAETLAVVRRAFDVKFQGKISMEDYVASQRKLDIPPPIQFFEPYNRPKSLLEKIIEMFLTPKQLEDLWSRSETLRYLWSLSIFDLLVVRFFYILSYMLILALELNAFAKGEKRISMPSRGTLTAIAALLLAIIWGSAQLGFSWSSMTA